MKLFLIACVVAVSFAAWQPSTSRDRHPEMTLVAIGPYASVPSGAKGVLWSHTLTHPDATSAVRIHVSVRRRRASPNWRIRFRDLAGQDVETVSSDSPMLATSGIWSNDIPGNGAIVELLADDAGSELEIAIDRYAFRNATKEDPIPNPSVVAIGSTAPQIQRWAAAVARLHAIQESGQYTCTAFLAAPTLLLTSRYCVETDESARSAIADFGFDGTDARPVVVRVMKLEAANELLDYALLRLNMAPKGFEPVRRFAGSPPKVGTQLVMFHHPGGGPKEASVDCRVGAIALAGMSAVKTDFGHTCVTTGGSGGAPVFDRSSGEVLGIHHFGSLDGAGFKQAVAMNLIMNDVLSNRPQLYRELVGSTTSPTK